jgi:hypothetical protein
MDWDGDSKNAVNTHFGKVGDIRRVFDYMGALTIDDVFRSVILTVRFYFPNVFDHGFLCAGVVFITTVPNTKLCAWGEEDSGGHVL